MATDRPSRFVSSPVTSLQLLSRFCKAVFVACLLSLCLLAAAAQSTKALEQQGWYADPEVHLFAGQYWIYPTSSLTVGDVPPPADASFNPVQQKLRAGPVYNPAYLLQTSLDALSSPDLVHWTRHPHVLDSANIAWAAYAVWAPSVLFRDGRYYLFFAANDLQAEDTFAGGIGLAVSDTPAGASKDVLGKPLIGSFHNGAQPIDPMAFEDDDRQVYLYYGGQGHCNVARLASDLRSVQPFNDGASFREITPDHYVEGPFMLKRKGVYYLMWSEGNWTDSTYGVAYARSSSPTGPFIFGGKILQSDPAIAGGPGHHSALNIPGTDVWYIAYHRHPLPSSGFGPDGANRRRLALDRLVFDAQGNILPVIMTSAGPGARPAVVSKALSP